MTDSPRPGAHWIKPNHASRAPARHIYFDTEARIEQLRKAQVQTWRLGVAAVDLRKSGAGDWADRQWCYATTPEQLWEWITEQTTERARTVVWAHNLGYDLRVSRALHVLPALGWELSRLRLSTRDATARFVNGKRTLVLTDLHSWAPTSLEHVGRLIGVDKLPLPAQDDDESFWWQRCEQDVTVLGDAVRVLLDWQARNDTGNWQPTGAGQAWSTWRHKHYTHKVLIHDDGDAFIAEREAVHAGRAEAWRHGRYNRTRLHEMDWSTAYAQVCRDVEVPTRLRASYRRPDLERVLRLSDDGKVLTKCVVTQEVPVAPCRVEGRLVWPVGRFVTTLWDQELAATVAAGADVEPIECWTYRSDPALREWALWALEILADDNPANGPLIRMIVKQQTRTLVGRFGLRYPEWESYGRALDDGADLSTLITPDYPRGTDLLHVGRELLVKSGMADGRDSFPAILGYVMAEVRVRLWSWMVTAGLENVFYVDTDGLIVSGKGRRRIEAANPDGLRSKGTYSTAEIRGPRQLVLSGKTRIAGIPTNAVPKGDDSYLFDAWETLGGSLRRGVPTQVTVRDRVARIPGVDNRRLHLNGGLTAERRVTMTDWSVGNQWADPELVRSA